jgi:hypothetical protein
VSGRPKQRPTDFDEGCLSDSTASELEEEEGSETISDTNWNLQHLDTSSGLRVDLDAIEVCIHLLLSPLRVCTQSLIPSVYLVHASFKRLMHLLHNTHTHTLHPCAGVHARQ